MCAAVGSGAMLNCGTASTSTIGGQCTACNSDFWPTALSMDTATLNTNACNALTNFPGGMCAAASTTTAGG
jgi:hypothetical protein